MERQWMAKIVQRDAVEGAVRKTAQKINNSIKSRICYENGNFHWRDYRLRNVRCIHFGEWVFFSRCNKVSASMLFADNDRHWNECNRCEWQTGKYTFGLCN